MAGKSIQQPYSSFHIGFISNPCLLQTKKQNSPGSMEGNSRNNKSNTR